MAPTFAPVMALDEHLLLRHQGGYNSGRSWQLGVLCLTDRRLLFAQGERQRAEVPLSCIIEMGIERRPFFVASRPCLALKQRNGKDAGRRVWLAVRHIEKWWKVMAGVVEEQGTVLRKADAGSEADASRSQLVRPCFRSDPRAAGPALRTARRNLAPTNGDRSRRIVPEARSGGADGSPADDVVQVAQLLDRASAGLVWHVWKNRHARLDELTAVLGETSHMNALVRIREEINPLALRLLGRPLLVFERSRIDERTGRQLLFSWWLNEETPRHPDAPPELVDVLDEGDHFLILLELPGVNEEEIELSVEGSTLAVTVDAADRRYHERVPLPAGASPDHLSAGYRNGILQVRLSKERMP